VEITDVYVFLVNKRLYSWLCARQNTVQGSIEKSNIVGQSALWTAALGGGWLHCNWLYL